MSLGHRASLFPLKTTDQRLLTSSPTSTQSIAGLSRYPRRNHFGRETLSSAASLLSRSDTLSIARPWW
jgi:hypothetical protein